MQAKIIPAVAVTYAQNGSSTSANPLGMRAMQERAYAKRGEQYLLIKSPPASGKSRALMFIALDKLHNQQLKKALIVVPERSIGSSFADMPLSKYGFYWDWQVAPRWNLCNAPLADMGKVDALKAFLAAPERILVCTHATFRFAVERFGIDIFDDCLIAIDEFHHVSANLDNKLGAHLNLLLKRNKTHIVAMTGSYFRGDAAAVLSPSDEAKFATVTYTYYEQLNGYKYLKTLNIGYYFYTGSYADEIMDVLDASEKTIIHIPNVNSRESSKDKIKEVEHIISELGEWQGSDPETGFQLVKTKSGSIIKIADLVDDDINKRDKVSAALKSPKCNGERDFVDMIIALGMAKEGFDWIWCEHALTVGYRSSLTEIVQIIGRATRDAKGKTHAKFTNLIAEPDASEEAVTDTVNDTLKAIAASLLMEQVLAPRINFAPKISSTPTALENVGAATDDLFANETGKISEQPGEYTIEVKGINPPISERAKRICKEDLNEIIAEFVQNKQTLERGLFDEETIPQELTQTAMGKIVRDRYPELSEHDKEAVRQQAVTALNLVQQGKIQQADAGGNTAFIDGVNKFALSVQELNIDLIDSINPFNAAYAILAKAMSAESLKQVEEAIIAKKIQLNEEEARELVARAARFKEDRGRLPELTAADPWERRMAEGIAYMLRLAKEEQKNG